MKENAWVDFKKVKDAVDMRMVLDHYGVIGLVESGDELRGPCPIHKGSQRSKNFTVNVRKNAFKCFSRDCEARGNVLDFVGAMEQCSVRDAALKLQEWFEIGDSDDPKKKSEKHPSLTPNAHESLRDLVAELEVHNSRIAFHSSQLETKTAAVKEFVTAMRKGD